MASEQFPRPFGRYQLLSNLAQGGMGALYLACHGDPGLEKLCVLKTVLPHLADAEYVARFRDEAKVVVRLSHGNLVPVFDAGVVTTSDGDQMYLAMEHVDGKDLRAVWNRCARRGIAFPVDVAVFIARELLRGLHYAHNFDSIKLVHRDVSPPNVLLSYSGEVKLTDFGLAASTMKTEKTAPGIVYGKVSYMSPEQARGEPLDGRTDEYAVAVILWELLTGRQLFAQSDPNLIERVRTPKVEPTSTFTARVPAPLEAILVKALSADRNDRFADCDEFRQTLAGFLAETAPTVDHSRIAGFLQDLFDEDMAAERAAQKQLLETAATARSAAQDSSQPETRPDRPMQNTPTGLSGTYIDGKYLVKRLLGEGGMGLVYEAEHVELGRKVAIKVLHAAYTRNPEVVSRFRSEARAATRIGHPHIVDVFDSGSTVDGAIYFVMERLEGEDLGALLREEGPLPIARALHITEQLCDALQAAHLANIIHRDMKPENVFLIDRDGERDFVKVLDFGIAKSLDSIQETRLTSPGLAMGTPEYMAPEQAAGNVADARVDVYAVGAILYEMLSGHPPHEGESVMEVLTRKATETPLSLSTLRPDVPVELDRLLERVLAKSPEERPQSMAALNQEIGALDLFSLRRKRVKKRTHSVFQMLQMAGGAAAIAASAYWVSGFLVDAPKIAKTAILKPEAPKVETTTLAVSTRTTVPAHPALASTSPPPTKVSAPAPTTAVHVIPVHHTATHSLPRQLTAALQSFAAGDAALRSGHYIEAETAYRRAQSLGGDPGRTASALADVAFRQGRYPDAAAEAVRAVKHGAGVEARMTLGNSYFKLKQYDDAAAAYQTVLRLSPHHAEAAADLQAVEERRQKK